jgi:hypothetical protein
MYLAFVCTFHLHFIVPEKQARKNPTNSRSSPAVPAREHLLRISFIAGRDVLCRSGAVSVEITITLLSENIQTSSYARPLGSLN